MLQAILHGKAGRIDGDKGQSNSWREVFKGREDLMTAAVFGRFAYLSAPVQATLMQRWLGVTEPAFDDFEQIDFWPSFSLANNDDRNRVEPDAVLNFASATVILEIKPPQGGDQYIDQWQREIASYLQAEERSQLPLYFLAIGRIPSRKIVNDWIDTLKSEFNSQLSGINALVWQPVVNDILALDKGALACEPNQQDKRIIADILHAARLYQLKTQAYSWQTLLEHPLPRLSLQQPLLQDKPLAKVCAQPARAGTAKPLRQWHDLFTFTAAHPLSLKDINTWNK
ncbi:hypothetical protein CF168_01775 [Shewanella bicestrii]|uniref:Uncharacterized protein n=1 Tax=Shewanella bicestrii TaxID=2018305 RepID=A0A220UHW4_9GAMM|nr:hypothetical protein [Shewanella bicestrii]ASK67685.1 hypothetical protein CF168_01775 [Shewanella bicestrii]